VEARRAAILDAAVSMLGERPVAEISLRELSQRVGLAKSNVLRYFDSREAIFLEVLGRVWSAWLDRLELACTGLRAPEAGFGREIELVRVTVGLLADDPLLCELLAAMGGVLERNISVPVAREFKLRAHANIARTVGLVAARLPHLGEPELWRFVHAFGALLAGLWPHAHPTEAVAEVLAEQGYPPPEEAFTVMFTETLTDQLIGLTVRARARTEAVR
jgi:AcrR family transcriptional regulator